MKKFLGISAILLTVLSLVSCDELARRKALLPNVSGKAGEVIVVINKVDWDGQLGNCLRENLACDCPFLPQQEPLYTLANVAPSGFTQIFKIHRNILLYNISNDVMEPKISFRHDVWAKPQRVIMISAQDAATAQTLTEENMPTILNFIEQAERDRVIENAKNFQEMSLKPAVEEVFGGSVYFPSGYRLKKKTDDFIWISYETTYTNQGILMYKYPADSGDGEFTTENIIFHRNEVMRNNVPGMFTGTYMTTSTFATPEIKYMNYKGRHFVETRGYWEVYGDFMGGPFVSHSFYSQDGKDIIVIEAFVYAPKYDKRHYLRQVESLLYSFQWKESEEAEEQKD